MVTQSTCDVDDDNKYYNKINSNIHYDLDIVLNALVCLVSRQYCKIVTVILTFAPMDLD